MSNLAPDMRVQSAIAAAVSFLAMGQDEDGYWRDYQLEPGRSEAWATACVGHALLAACRYSQASRPALKLAAAALLAERRPEGWGYNRKTSCDADSTSWVIRFLAQLGMMGSVCAAAVLTPYLTTTGGVRTFGSVDLFGSWAEEHDEVAPLAGLALLAVAEHGYVTSIRAAVLDAWFRRGWQPFWWNCRAYVCAQSLEFLLGTGGLPEALAESERARLTESPTPANAFDAAQRLAAAVYLDAPREAWRLGEALLGLQCKDGGWPASSVLLVPHQRESSKVEAHGDDRRLLSSAVSLVALTKWLRPEKGADCRQEDEDAPYCKGWN